MLLTIAFLLAILWVLGVITSTVAGGLIHILLIVAVVLFIFSFV
jgi:hypothetical protein